MRQRYMGSGGSLNSQNLFYILLGAIRLLMRRDKTLKLCANHAIQPWMLLRPNCGSDRAFVWSVHEDYADEEAKTEMLAIRFANADNAKKFKAQVSVIFCGKLNIYVQQFFLSITKNFIIGVFLLNYSVKVCHKVSFERSFILVF